MKWLVHVYAGVPGLQVGESRPFSGLGPNVFP